MCAKTNLGRALGVMVTTSDDKILIKNASILATPGRILRNASILISSGMIKKIGKGTISKSVDIKIDARGRIVMPALSCAHTHIYSFLARGMSLETFVPPKNFVQILENLWWRLDQALTLKDVSVSAQGAMLELAKCGVVTFADHHASPNAIEGSLNVIAKEVEKFGLKARLSYEVTDRNGKAGARKGIEENVSFIKSHKTHPTIKGDFGLHASLTLSKETLAECAQAGRKLGCGFHVHVAEDLADQKDCLKKHNARVVERFHKEKILGPKTFAVHCVHINDREAGLLKKTGTQVIHNPQSNMNNGVGVAPIPKLMAKGIRVGLGTDGFTADMFQESKTAFTIHKLKEKNPRTMPPAKVYDMLFSNNPRILGFGNGTIREGAPADIMILDYNSPTQVSSKNIASHFIFGMNASCVEHVLCNGIPIVLERKLVTKDSEKILQSCSKRAKLLWTRIDKKF